MVLDHPGLIQLFFLFSGGRKRNAVSNVKIALSTVGTPSRSNSSLIFTMLLANITEKIKVSRYSIPRVDEPTKMATTP